MYLLAQRADTSQRTNEIADIWASYSYTESFEIYFRLLSVRAIKCCVCVCVCVRVRVCVCVCHGSESFRCLTLKTESRSLSCLL
jgi:hypothetical protein